jgi:hypothetical protein
MGLRVTVIKIGPKHDVSTGRAQEAMIFENRKEEKGVEGRVWEYRDALGKFRTLQCGVVWELKSAASQGVGCNAGAM